MPVDSKHATYLKRADDWRLVSDILEGESAIKSAGELYLPKLSKQTAKEYDAYKARGSFFNASFRTIQGLSGAAMRKDPVIEASDDVLDTLDSITLDGLSIRDVIRLVVGELISYGYFGILIDIEAGEGPVAPYFSLYNAANIYNWKFRRTGSSLGLVLLVLKEIEFVDGEDEYETIAEERMRVLSLEDGFLKSTVYRMNKRGDWLLDSESVPSIRGKRLDKIPFQFFGSSVNVPIPDKPPLIDLMYANIQHWKINVDYHHGLHYCAIPTPWAAGWPTEKELTVGGTRAWTTEDSNAKCGYLEFSGSGLGALKAEIKDIEQRMAVLGARLLEEQKRAVEAAETWRIRTAGDSASLSTIVNCVELGFTNLITIVSELMLSKGEVSVSMNKDFIAEKLSPQEMTALLQMLQAGKISQDTFLYQLQLGEILPEDRSIDDEKELIDLDNSKDFNNVRPLFGGDNNTSATANLLMLRR